MICPHRSVTLALLVATILATFGVVPLRAQGDQQCFAETGFCIGGRIRAYWQQNGGLPVFGYPLSAARPEPNRDTGATYLTQYFERARFEVHPNNDPPYDVLLGRLGDDLRIRRGDTWTPSSTPGNPNYVDPAAPLYFPETGFAINTAFIDYWRSNGLEFGDPGVSQRESLALWGMPIGPAFRDINFDGDEVYTQFFERAVFEQHFEYIGEGQNRFTILLGRIVANLRAYDQPSTNGYLAFDSGVIYNPQSHARWRIPCQSGVWSPDGARLACGREVQIMRLDGSEVVAAGMIGHSQSWSPDGSRVVFINGNLSDAGDIFVLNADGSGLQQLTSTPAREERPRWSPDGSRILFNAFAGEVSQVYTINADGTNLRQLTTQDGVDAEWSPDGSRIVFTTKRAGNTDIYVMNADGSDQRPLTGEATDEHTPLWSGDGALIAFQRTIPRTNPGLDYESVHVVNATTGQQSTIADSGFDTYLVRWSPDGTRVVYGEITAYALIYRTARPDGSDPQPLTTGSGLAWSPDASTIALTRDVRVGMDAYLRAVDGTTQRMIGRNIGINVEWSPR
jgi:Tol biopolymer transport system component